VRILQLVSCRGWSSDAYLAARLSSELARRGHDVWLGCRRGTETRVMTRARAEGVQRLEAFGFSGGMAPAGDVADVRRLLRWLPEVDVVHTHRSKEHWLVAMANRLSGTPRPVVRTRHIVQAVRPHAANRWLYGRATALVHTVSEAIRRQYVASGLVPPGRAVALPGGVDVDRHARAEPSPHLRRRAGAGDAEILVGLVAGLRVMKGHDVAVEAVARLGADGDRLRFAFVGAGSQEGRIRKMLDERAPGGRIVLAGFADDLPAVMAALDMGLYVPVESEGMSRVVFEYLAAGCALIAARVGVVPEILGHREHALLVPAGDAEALGDAMAELGRDAPLRRRLGAAGRALVVERYSGARLAESLERHYARLAESREGSGVRLACP
jgi:glycosyltransferase involved in cell wall biosynthesis